MKEFNLEEAFASLNRRFDGLEGRLDSMESRLDSMESRLGGVESRLDKLENSVKDIQLTLENETNRNIAIVAEGHLDLSRKLNEVLAQNSENEIFKIRLNYLEGQVRRMQTTVK